MDHVRVHPKFLHSNATSHKWALGGIFQHVFIPIMIHMLFFPIFNLLCSMSSYVFYVFELLKCFIWYLMHENNGYHMAIGGNPYNWLKAHGNMWLHPSLKTNYGIPRLPYDAYWSLNKRNTIFVASIACEWYIHIHPELSGLDYKMMSV